MGLVEHSKIALDCCWETRNHSVVHHDGCALWTMPGDDSSGVGKHGGRHLVVSSSYGLDGMEDKRDE